MTSAFHPGELAIQGRVGSQAMAQKIANGIRPFIPPVAQAFLKLQSTVILSSVSANGQVWASILSGKPGFVQAVAADLVQIKTPPLPSDPLSTNLSETGEIGLLAIELATRKRMRLNGKAELAADGTIWVRTREVWSNCPRYIQVRQISEEVSATQVPTSQNTEKLTLAQKGWIEQADTFFIASYYPEKGADASHRGGKPGFVHILNDSELIFPDYAGNQMFQTLGNLMAYPNAGLLFLDFDSGATLQLSGKTEIIWDEAYTSQFAGAERVIRYRIEEISETHAVLPVRWQLVEYSEWLP